MTDETEKPLEMTCAKLLPGGALDDCTFSQIEDALDKAEAPMTNAGRWLTLPERIAALAIRASHESTTCNGNRPLPFDREVLGRMVREAWVRWAQTQPTPKTSWLVAYDDLPEADKEADRQIGESVARWTLIGAAAGASLPSDSTSNVD